MMLLCPGGGREFVRRRGKDYEQRSVGQKESEEPKVKDEWARTWWQDYFVSPTAVMMGMTVQEGEEETEEREQR